MIDNIANENSMKLLKKPVRIERENKTTTNNIRMTYGDINYVGSNRAIFYFDRGIRGKQTFTNSMYPLDRHPKHKDIVIIDEIVVPPCSLSIGSLMRLDSRAQLDSTNTKG